MPAHGPPRRHPLRRSPDRHPATPGGSARAIQAKLSAKGVDRTIVAAVLDAGVEDEEAAAQALARRRRLGPFRPGERALHHGKDMHHDKDMAVLARAGFSYGVARRVIEGDDREA